jgi:hypothetical protein
MYTNTQTWLREFENSTIRFAASRVEPRFRSSESSPSSSELRLHAGARVGCTAVESSRIYLKLDSI